MGIIVALLAVSIGAWSYAISSYYTNKEELILQAADFFEQVALPYKLAKLAREPRDEMLLMPLRDVRTEEVANSWGNPRSGGRSHEGIDIFAARGTPVYAVASGFVLRTGVNALGGTYVFTIGKGGVRYYYAHLEAIAAGIEFGTPVTTDTVLGFVGTTGNAAGTEPHLHLGMYQNGAQNPYDLLIDR